jgi:hypothetical protein
VLPPSPASEGSPSANERTALVMIVIGWFSATGCSQPGIESTGTIALDTNDSGKISSDIPWAACTFPATRPSQTNTHMKANPNTRVRPNAATASTIVPSGRKPTATPMAAVAARPRASRPVSATTRPARTAVRDTGSDFSRSVKPSSMSCATLDEALDPVNRTLVTM